METEFKADAAYCDTIFSAYELQVSTDGSRARYRYSCECTGGTIYHMGRWQDIKYTAKGKPYITGREYRLYIDNFMRV